MAYDLMLLRDESHTGKSLEALFILRRARDFFIYGFRRLSFFFAANCEDEPCVHGVSISRVLKDFLVPAP